MAPILAIIGSIVSVTVSGALILHLWTVHRTDSLLRRLFWSLVLLIPLYGWVFYGGFYRAPGAGPLHWQDRNGRSIDYGSFGLF